MRRPKLEKCGHGHMRHLSLKNYAAGWELQLDVRSSHKLFDKNREIMSKWRRSLRLLAIDFAIATTNERSGLLFDVTRRMVLFKPSRRKTPLRFLHNHNSNLGAGALKKF